MQDLHSWTLEVIRKNSLDWIEPRREDWTPLLASKFALLLEGRPFLLFCDDERAWFLDYFMSRVNRGKSRPHLPFFALSALYPPLKEIQSKEDMQLLGDMLNLAFPQGFVYFYIGSGKAEISYIAKNKNDSYMWLIDEQLQNGFTLNSKEDAISKCLIDMFSLFDKSIDAVIFDEVML